MFQAFPGQDHRAHITAHLAFMATNIARNNPMISAALDKKYYGTYFSNVSRTN